MDHSCYRCGAPVEEHTTFCPSCGAPQIRVTSPSTASGHETSSPPLPPGTPDSMEPPAIPVAFAAPGQIQWRRFWRIALPLGAISALGIGLFGIFGVILFLVSLVIAIRRYAREHEGPLTASQGARLGAGTAMVSYLVVLIFFVVQVAIDFSEFRQQWLQSLQQKTGGNPDPQIQRFAEWAAGNQGILVLSLISVLISAVLIAIFCGLIGAIVASSSREKPR